MCCCGIQNRFVITRKNHSKKITRKKSLETAKLRHRVACREQRCRWRTRCACPLPRQPCAQNVQALPPCITGHLSCPLLRGWATDQRTGCGGAWGRGWGTDRRTGGGGASGGAGQPTLAVENSYAVYHGGDNPVMVLPVPPQPPLYNEL